MFMGMGMPVPDLSNLPGPSRPGYPSGDVGSYDFKFEVTGAVTIKANANAAGTFTVTWPDGTTQALSGDNASVAAPDDTGGIVSINKQSDATFCDEFAIVSGEANVSRVISWGENPWASIYEAFRNCGSLTDISTTSFIAGNNCSMRNAFYGCSALTSANISNWDLSQGIDPLGLFYNCTGLETIDATNLNLVLSSSSQSMFRATGTNVTNGCVYKMSGLNITCENAYSSVQMLYWFSGSRINPSSDFSNWTFPTNHTYHSQIYFDSCVVTGTNSVLNLSNWTNYKSTRLPALSFVTSPSGGSSNLRVNITNLNASTVTSLNRAFQASQFSEIIGLDTLGATAGVTDMQYAFDDCRFLKFTNYNLSSAFRNSIAITAGAGFSSVFEDVGASLQLSDAGSPPNLDGIDISGTASMGGLFKNARFSTSPDFSNLILNPTTAYSLGNMFGAFQVNDNSNVNSLFSKTFKVSSFSNTFNNSNLSSLSIGSSVDFAPNTSFNRAFLGANQMTVEFPTNIDFSGLTTSTSLQYIFYAGPTLSTCQVDNFIRRLHATALTTGLAIDFNNASITGAPSVVQSLETELVSNGWSITTNSTDATLPFAYPTYSFDSDQVQSTTPSTLPPARS